MSLAMNVSSCVGSSPTSSRIKHKPKLSAVSICVGNCNIPSAIGQILEFYIRDLENQTMIVLIEESGYNEFEHSWHQLFARMVTSLDVKVDMNCIDIRAAYHNKRSPNMIYIVKFLNINDLKKLIGKLGEIAHILVWNLDHLYAREICLALAHLNQCSAFWLNHTPASLSDHQTTSDQCNELDVHLSNIHNNNNSNSRLMDEIYSDIMSDCQSQVDYLRRLQARFLLRHCESKRVGTILRLYLKIITKFRSLKPTNLSVDESVIRLRRFHMDSADLVTETPSTEGSHIESVLRPVGVCIILVNNETHLKSKSLLVELIFKNLLVGNGVLLAGPNAILGSRFPLDWFKQQKIPFDIMELHTLPIAEIAPVDRAPPPPPTTTTAHSSNQKNVTPPRESSPIHQVSTPVELLASIAGVDSPDSGVETSCLHKKSNTKRSSSIYIVDLSTYDDLNSVKIDIIVLDLGCKFKRILFTDGYRLNPKQ